MSKFYDALKDVLVQNLPQHACEYYHTALQHQDELQELIDLCEKHEFEVNYYDSDDDYGYTEGKISVWFHDGHYSYNNEIEFQYEISLGWDERHWGYCQCEPTDEGYSSEHRCCGMGCDATFAKITLTKSKSKVFAFDGYEKDLWALQAEWNGQGKDEYERMQKEMQLHNLDEEIQKLIEKRDQLKNEIE